MQHILNRAEPLMQTGNDTTTTIDAATKPAKRAAAAAAGAATGPDDSTSTRAEEGPNVGATTNANGNATAAIAATAIADSHLPDSASHLADDVFTALVSRHSAAVYRLALSRLRDEADAEDVCQTVFMRLYTAAPTFESPDHERAWLLRATINCCHDAHRSPWRRHTSRGEGAQTAAKVSLDRRSLRQHREQQDRDELSLLIDEAMQSLTAKQRTVVHLFYYEDYSTEDIARITGERPSTVRSHLHRARKTLKQQLGAHL